jgi:hypothetical protein
MSKQPGKASEPPPPTVKPPYDQEEFARQTDTKIRLESLPPSARPTMSPPADAATLARGSDVPVLAVAREDLEWFELTPSARDLLRQVNGRDTVEAIASLLRLPGDGLLAELDVLARDGLITWR